MVKMYRLKIFKGVIFLIFFFDLVLSKSCDDHDVVKQQCHESQLCDTDTKTCQCRPGYKAHNDSFCINVNPRNSRASTPNTSSLVASHSSGSVVAGILIPLILILFVIYAVYVSRKYKLVTWFRRKIHQRNNNYDEFMIGQDPEDDDPPLN